MAQEFIEEVFLSICIPTYNKRDRIAELIYDYLKQIPYEVELVVVDDCSTDNTEEVLKNIYDKRFFYYRNKERLGYINMIQALTKGNGKYCMLVGDKDRILFHIDWLIKLKKIINEYNDPACILCNYGFMDRKTELLCVDTMKNVYKKGSKEIFNTAINKTGYSSSLIFNREILVKILNKNISYENSLLRLYPQSYIAFLMGKEGDMVPLKRINFIIREIENTKSNQIENVINNYKPYFTIDSRYEQVKDWINLIESTTIEKTVKSKLIIDLRYGMIEKIRQYYWLLHKNFSLEESGIYKQYKFQFDEDRKIKKKEWLKCIFSYLHQLKYKNYNKNIEILLYKLKKIIESFYILIKLVFQ